MRSLTDLQAIADQNDVAYAPDASREDIMDALRDQLGTIDPTVEIDPAKAQDLKKGIDWPAFAEGDVATAFKGIASHLTDAWVLEPKLDGARMRVFLGSTGNTLNTGRRSDVTYKYIDRSDNFPHIRDCVVPPFAGTILDGEMMPPVNSIETKPGEWTMGPLNTIVALTNSNPALSVQRQEKYGKAYFVAFDILAFNGDDVTHLPLEQRRQMLEQIVDALAEHEPTIQITTQMEASVENIVKVLDAGFEGAMLKKRDARYIPGQRMAAWQKVKRMSTGDFFVVGSKDGKGRNEGKVGALKLAYWDGEKPVEVADTRGFDDALCDAMSGPDGKVKPEWIGKVVEIMGQGRTKNDRIRHPHFVRLREDKVYTDCTRDQLELFTEV